MENNIKGHQVASLKALHEMYNLGDGIEDIGFSVKARVRK